jgi:predicted ATP-grasp superfamily ATP-dependent carboligase
VANERTTGRQPASAVVIGLDSLQGLQSARLLDRRGVRVVAIASRPDHPYCRTNTVDRVFTGSTGTSQLLDVLADVASETADRPVLIPCQDKSVRVLSDHAHQLTSDFRMTLPPAGSINTLMDKASFLDHARSLGLPIPPSVVVRGPEDLEEALDTLSFPCIFKPVIRSQLWDANTKLKALVISGPSELRSTYERCASWADAFIVQVYIDGGADALYSFNGYFDRDGAPLATFVARKLRQWPPKSGSSCFGEEVRDDAVLELGLRIFDSVPYRGLGYLETKRDPRTGTQYLIEANVGRPTGRSAIAEAGGVELLYTMYCDTVGLPLPANRQQRYTGVKWLDLRHDIQAGFVQWRDGELRISDWMTSYRGPKVHAIASRHDPLPFLADMTSAAGMGLSRLWAGGRSPG